MRKTGLPAGTRAVAVRVLDAVGARCTARADVAQQFLDGGGNLAAVLEQHLPLFGVLGEHDHRTADQFGHRLRARAAEKRRESGDLDVVELSHSAVLARGFGGDQAADHVVLRVLPPLLGQAVVKHPDVDVGLHAFVAELELPGLAIEALVDPVPDLLRRNSSGTPAIRVMTSTGNGPEKSCTTSKSSGSALAEVVLDRSMTVSAAPGWPAA